MPQWVVDKNEYISFGSYFKINCHCSQCGQEVTFVESKQNKDKNQLKITVNEDISVYAYFDMDNYCRNCGADMREKQKGRR